MDITKININNLLYSYNMVYLHTFAIPLEEPLSLPTRVYVHAFKE